MSGGTIVVGIVIALFAGVVLLQYLFVRRALAMEGKAVPTLPGDVGRSIAARKTALVYFFSPQCGACRAITPRVRAMAAKNPSVFAVDVTSDIALARALGVMATPSTVEIRDGTIAGYHVGPIPAPVMERFA